MKKTLLITHEYYPFHGGVGRYCYQLFKRLPSQSYVVMTDQNSASGGPIVQRRLLSRYLRPRWWGGMSMLRRFINKEGIELLVTPHILPLGRQALAVRRTLGIPYVISLHGMDINLALRNRLSTTQAILESASHIIVNSEATARILDPLKLRTPVTVLTPYLDTEKFVAMEHDTDIAQRYAGKRLILTVGRLVRRKGQDTVLRALPTVLAAAPNTHYCIVGDGPDRRYLESLIAELRLDAHVEILAGISDAALGQYYEAASVFAMPTRAIGPDVEGFGISYLEAAFFSLPIVAGESGGEREALGGEPHAVFVNGESVEAVADTLINILADAELASYLGMQAKQHLASLPNWDTQSKRLAQILS